MLFLKNYYYVYYHYTLLIEKNKSLFYLLHKSNTLLMGYLLLVS